MLHNLFLALDGARARNDDNFFSADFDIVDADHRRIGMCLPAYQLVWPQNRFDKLDAGKRLERLFAEEVFIADNGDDRSLYAGG